MSYYTVERGRQDKRGEVETWLHGLDLVSSNTRERIVTAWVTTWTSSTHGRLEDLPYSTLAPEFPLAQHVNEVTRTGLDLARRASAEWNDPVDLEVLVPILILHDVDKPLLYIRQGGELTYAPLFKEVPHGVVGAMLLHELGFADRVIATVATHAANAPFHGDTLEAFVLHYADFFSTDRALMRGRSQQPFYQKHWH